MKSYDFVVVGAGSVGSQIFYHLATSGAGSVLALEQFTPAYTRTAVGGDTRLFRLAYSEGLNYQPILNESLKQWNELNERTGRKVFEQTGCLYIGPEDSGYMTSLRENTAAAGVECFPVSHDQARDDFPQHRLNDDDTVLLDPSGGFIRTDLAVQSAVDLGRQHGGEVQQFRKLNRISRYASGGFVLSTDQDAFHAGEVILATGAWSTPLLSESLVDLVEVRRDALTWFGTTKPEMFLPSVFPVFKRVTPGINVFGAPSVDGTQIKVSLAESFPTASPDNVDQGLYPDELERVTRAIEAGFNFVNSGVVRSDAFPDLYTADHTPLVGRDPGTGAYVALGLSGKGFKMSSGLGALIARDLVSNDVPELDFVSPDRFFSTTTAAA